MSNEQATNDAEQKPGKLTESIDRMADKLEKVIKTASSAYDRLAHVELRDGQGAAWCLLSKAIGEIRHVLGPCAIMPEACFQKLREFANQPRGTGEFFTPKEALDAVTANPPLGDVEDAPRPLDPNAPEIVTGGVQSMTGEDSHMSRPEAANILCVMATSRKIDVNGVVALQMGVRSLMKRHFDCQRNRAMRRARAAKETEVQPNV